MKNNVGREKYIISCLGLKLLENITHVRKKKKKDERYYLFSTLDYKLIFVNSFSESDI